MKKLLTETTKLFTLVCCVFVMFSCGGDNECQTCTMEGQDDIEVCEDDFPGDVLNAAYNLQITTNEGLGYTCE